ncbi:maleylpyruvate isomerase N-terminal domain-containing protein [Streptomyces beihaiensis]|uniref:Mycothiol-dependent maleylpyruvate isomerase metal-binding domain-containing protein n=1 Tax=Streptomyces beihaiensis TaxID=2984495 RepID=A0ABT3TV90_9ACTN|nr:maleylpyruvate isomerase N-terminal domain-containing protein [Streptomyces beihaiensis]MCX3060964.1 hypothetical protein [Streptomyces beihaiensis]
MPTEPNTSAAPATATPVTADDVARAVELAVAALRPAAGADWDVRAGKVEWTCRETAEHLADDLFFYAAHIGSLRPVTDGDLPFGWTARRPEGPKNTVTVETDAGPEGLFSVLEACGGLLAAVVRATPPTARAHHVFGVSDPEGFAAMGVVETLVHAYDIARGLGARFEPPAALCSRALRRLFPDAPTGTAPWPTLLWATGRGELDGRARPRQWRWYGAPRAT